MNDDCLCYIFSFLDIISITNCLLTSKRFNIIAKNDFIWGQIFINKFCDKRITKNYYCNYKIYDNFNKFIFENSRLYNTSNSDECNNWLKFTINIHCIIPSKYFHYKTIPPQIELLVNLQYIYLDAVGLESIPPEIGNLPSLIDLNMSNNKIQKIPCEIGNLTSSLRIINLSCNKIRSIPKEMGKLISLKTLSLNNNKIQLVPREIGKLTQLVVLELHSNKIQRLPSEIGNLISLHTLRLNNNKLKFIPNEIENLNNLRYLLLSSNKIDIHKSPIKIGQLTKIKNFSRENRTYRNHFTLLYER